MEQTHSHRRLIVLLWLAVAASLAGAARADDAADQYNVASGFFKMNRYDFAAEEYEKFLKDYPKHELVPEALYFLGESQYLLNKLDDARSQFRKLVAQYPGTRNFYNALYRIGETSLLLGDFKSAEPLLNEFVAKRPDDPLLELALADLGRVQLRTGTWKEAKATLERSLQKFPKGRLVDRNQYDLAQTLERLNDTQAALALYRTLAASSTSKLAADAQLAIGVRLFEDKNYDGAVQAFADLERRFPSSPLVPSAKLNRGLCLYQSQRYDQALALLESLAGGESSAVPEAWYWLGMTQKARRQFETAAKTLQEAYTKFASSPLAPEMLFYSAQATFQQGQPAAALDRFLEVAGKFPKHELADDSLYHAAESARAGGQHERTLSLAAQLNKDFPQSAMSNRTALTAGQSLIALGRNDEAAKQLGELVDRRPEPAVAAPAWYYRAVALHAAGKVDAALAVLEPLAADEPKDPAWLAILPDAHFLIGSLYVEKRDYAKAVPPLEKYLAARPSGDAVAQALSYLVVSHATLGRLEPLRATLDALRGKAANEQSLPAIYRVADVCYEAQQYALAGELFAEVAQKDPQGPLHAKALSGLAWTRFQERKYDEAAQHFNQVVESHPADPLASEGCYMRGRSLEAQSKLAEAIAAYQAVLGKYEKSPHAFDAGLQLARTLHKAGKSADAVAAYEDLAKRFPQANTLDVALHEWAWVHLAMGQEAEAQQIFQRLAAQFPDSPLVPEATLNVAEARFQARQFSEVVARLKPLLAKELSPKLREAALYRLGRTQVELKAWPDARESFDALVKEFPSSALRREAEFWTAETERQGGQPKAAAERLTKLVAEPVEPEPWLGTAWLRLAQCQGELKQWKEALATIEQLKQRFPKYESLNVAEYHAGRALQNLARFHEAREAYRRAIAGRHDENAAQSQFMIGETFFHQKRYDEALRAFGRVEILYPYPHWQAAALLEAAKCHEYLQEWSRAAETYNRILEKYPKTTHAAEAAQRLPEARKKLASNTSSGRGTP